MRAHYVHLTVIFVVVFLHKFQLNARTVDGDRFGKLLMFSYACYNFPNNIYVQTPEGANCDLLSCQCNSRGR